MYIKIGRISKLLITLTSNAHSSTPCAVETCPQIARQFVELIAHHKKLSCIQRQAEIGYIKAQQTLAVGTKAMFYDICIELQKIEKANVATKLLQMHC